MVFENLVALHIAIEKQCPPETAFKYLDNFLERKTSKVYFQWSNEDIADIHKLRSKGVKYKEIASYYGTSERNIISMLCMRKKRMAQHEA